MPVPVETICYDANGLNETMTITPDERWLTTTIFLSVPCYNGTMLKQDYYNDFFDFGQQKINFSFFELSLPDDDPVYTLKNVMED